MNRAWRGLASPNLPARLRPLAWALAAFGSAVLLHIDRLPPWISLFALGTAIARVLLALRGSTLPGAWLRAGIAIVLTLGVLAGFRTLNGLSAGSALLVAMGSLKLLETRARRDDYVMLGVALFLLLAACLDRQGLTRVPLYALQLWISCAALAVIAAPDALAGVRAPMQLAGRSLACALPLALLLLIVLHIVALRQTGSNNPDGIEIKAKLGANGKPLDGIPFHPYYTLKDIVGIGVFLVGFAIVVFFVPTFGGLFLEKPNFEPANALSTPEHIAPVWYFTPFYAILRAVPDQRLGALLMGLAVLAFLFLPWLDRSPVKSTRYRGWIWKLALTVFTVSFLALMYLGLMPAEGLYVMLARIFTVGYFAFFVLMPFYTRIDPVKAVPERVTYHA